MQVRIVPIFPYLSQALTLFIGLIKEMKMFNKLKFNNLVISNKQGIQQSRIQTINKLVHKIRKLKTLSEKHPDNKKFKERIRKATETMELLKKLKRMDIVKKVLLMDKTAPAIITNGLATPEEVAVAFLSMNKVMQSLIKRFRMELQLNEEEKDDWKQVLIAVSKRSQKIDRTEQKRRKRLEMKQQKAMGRKRQEWLEANKHNIDANISGDTDLKTSTTDTWKIEELSKDNNIKEMVDKTVEMSNKETVSKKTTEANNKNHKLKNKRDIRNAKNKNFKKEMEDDKLNTSRTMIITNQNECSNDTVEDTKESLVVDPFFITGTGENYMSTAIIKRENFDEVENIGKRDLHMIKLNNCDKKPVAVRDRQKQKYLTQQNANKWNIEKQSNKFLQRKFNDKNNFQIKQNSNNKKSVNSKEIGLHPSWAAKQKLKPIITGFQGKKKTFDDDASSQSNQHQVDSKTKKSSDKTANKSEKDSLHPSWAAKQKLKPAITAFQGKKITFDNYE